MYLNSVSFPFGLTSLFMLYLEVKKRDCGDRAITL